MKQIQQYLKKHGFKAYHPKAVLFDMDGVLFDSMPNHASSWHKAMEQCGLKMAKSEAYLYEGMRGVETIKLKARQQWKREISDEEAQRMYELKTTYFAQCPPAPKMDGVEKLMRRIKSSGMKIGIVTGSGQHTLLDHLQQAFPGLINQELIVSGFDVQHGKPDPEPYLVGLRKTGVHPWEAIVIENAPLGVRAAVAAQILTVAVNTGPLPDTLLKREGANLIVKRMADVEALWGQLAQSQKSIVPVSHNEKWDTQYHNILSYIKQNAHRPSKHKPEDLKMVNWIKYNKKRLASGTLPEARKNQFLKLLDIMKNYQRINQWAYVKEPQQLDLDL